MATLSYVNVRKLVGMLSETLEQVQPQQAEVIDKLGLRKIDFLATVCGLDDSGCVTRNWLKMDGKPPLFLKLLDGPPLSSNDLKAIPADASIAAAFRFDPQRTLKEFHMMDSVGPRPGTGDEIFRNLDAMSTEIGFSIREDLLPALGDVWRVYHRPAKADRSSPIGRRSFRFATARRWPTSPRSSHSRPAKPAVAKGN